MISRSSIQNHLEAKKQIEIKDGAGVSTHSKYEKEHFISCKYLLQLISL